MKTFHIFLFASLFVLASHAQEGALAPVEENVTIITSDELTFESARNYAIFEKNVVVKDPQLDLTCDVMEVFFTKDNDIERIIAKGQVLIQNSDMIAQAGKATYEVTKEKLTLEINPKVAEPPEDPKKILQGGVIVYDQKNSKLHASKGTRTIILRGKGDVSPFTPGGKP